MQRSEPFNYHSIEEMRIAAADHLDAIAFQYLEGNAGDGVTFENNIQAFRKWAFVPRRLQGISHPSLTTEIFGIKYNLPFGAAPVGVQKLFHEQGEKATVRACDIHGAPCILSTVSNLSFKEATKESLLKPWFQLYPTNNKAITEKLIHNAEEAGADVIVVTVDVPILGKRRHNAKALLDKSENPQLIFGNLNDLLKEGDEIHFYGMDWSLFDFIRKNTNCKLIIKGVLHPKDAISAMNNGADGLMISNHGGRQLDSSISTLEALIAIKEILPADYPVLLDGGIRSAEDILKALFLGARMVFLGRPLVYGLAVGGQEGVSYLWEMLSNDLTRDMILMGVQDVNKLNKSQIIQI